ncbi:MAG: hypothetical protein B1H11_07700 [Desulfobacteraceae bacterium 4484_190.1]|nr:MAG: hypothetical protein B1H11_07700 [Desulfobacteraceae bacterium 4484_190.1]
MISSKSRKLTLIFVCTMAAFACISLFSRNLKVTLEQSPYGETAFAKAVSKEAPLSKKAREHFKKAHQFLKSRQLEKALKEFKKTVELSPETPIAHYWLGMAYFYKKEFKKAIEKFQKVLEFEPENYHALAMIGKIFTFNKNKLDDAAKYLRKALSINPEFAEAHSDMAHVQAMRGNLSKAIAEFGVIFQGEPRYAKYHYELGRLFESMKAFDRAKAEFKRALALNPKMTRAKKALERLK